MFLCSSWLLVNAAVVNVLTAWQRHNCHDAETTVQLGF
jgi:hypothetical protein